MTDLRKAAEMALETLVKQHEWMVTNDGMFQIPSRKAIEALRQALAQPEQEPPANKYNEKRIAWELERTALGDGYYGNAMYVAMDMPQTTKADKEMLHRYMCGSNLKTDHVKLQDLAMRIYTAPLKRKWVGLTDEEIAGMPWDDMFDFAYAIEAKLKEKNT